MKDERGAIAFGEKVLALLDQGSFTATYKYAVLLGLIDLSLAGFTKDGRAPDSVTTRQLAEVVTRLYWGQVVPFGNEGTVLRQSRGGQAEIVAIVAKARGAAAVPLARARWEDPAAYERLVRDVEWKLVEMPLPRLQRFGRSEERFIYELDWDQTIKRSHWKDPTRFPNQLRFVEGAGDHLVRLAGLLRPLLQRKWSAEVSRTNALEDSGLEDFLFGTERATLAPVLDGLRELQEDRCFYCAGRLKQPQVDHFLPWARVPLDAIENLVVAHDACNLSKRDFLAAASHVEAWSERLRRRGDSLAGIAAAARWEHAPERAIGVARALYLPLPAAARLWSAREAFVPPETARLRTALA